MARRPIVDALEIAVKDLDASIEQRAYRQEPFFLSVHKVFGRPAREKSEELIGGRIPPIAYLIAEFGFPFCCFFDHTCTPYSIILARKTPGAAPCERCSRPIYNILPAFRARRTRNGYRWGFGNKNTRATSQKLTVRPSRSNRMLLTRR